jgi:hypothetical protein
VIRIYLTIIAGALIFPCVDLLAQRQTTTVASLSFREQGDLGKVDVYYNGDLLTSYIYKSDSVNKPILFPLRTRSGIEVTRGYPLRPRAGERTDHPHQVGLWMTYESVNGIDFWNSSYAIDPSKKLSYGSIKHNQVRYTEGKRRGLLEAESTWIAHDGSNLLNENTLYSFTLNHSDVIIDRVSTLTALADTVLFRDVKDGFIGMRVARELELPSKQEDKFVDVHGNVTTVAQMNNEGVTGMYISRDSLSGDDVWGTRSPWVCLNGIKDGKKVSIVIFDHRKNVGYPTYWHARGYGLFAANPLGQAVFSNEMQTLNYRLKKDESLTFRYRILIHEGEHYPGKKLDEIHKAFSRQVSIKRGK